MKFENKTVIITGAGGGVGRQLVIQSLEKGASVAAVDINDKALKETLNLAGSKADKVSTHKVDITNRKSVCVLPDEVIKTHGSADILINNAGIVQPFIPFSKMDLETIQRVLNINLYGILFITRAFLPHLAEQPKAYIANVSSMGGFIPVPGQTIYGASKAAVKLFTDGLRSELSKTRIGVSVIIPGGLETEILENSGVDFAMDKEKAKKANVVKLTTPKKAAQKIIKGIEKEKAQIVIGKDAFFLDFYKRLAPVKANRFIAKMMEANVGNIFGDPEELRKKHCL